MEFDFDRVKEQALELADKAKKVAVELADKGKEQVQLMELEAKLSKAQRQLGALVYSLAKAGEENQALVEKYVQVIDEIEKSIEELKCTMAPQAEPEPPVCPHCGAEVGEEQLFCDKCGAQL